jgi:hypothetical protein
VTTQNFMLKNTNQQTYADLHILAEIGIVRELNRGPEIEFFDVATAVGSEKEVQKRLLATYSARTQTLIWKERNAVRVIRTLVRRHLRNAQHIHELAQQFIQSSWSSGDDLPSTDRVGGSNASAN